MVHRIKPLIPDLISYNQGAFVPGRKVTDNVIVAQELIASFKRKKKSNFGWMMIKIDLEKAFDKLNWNFIQSTLHAFGFPISWIDMMMNSISSVNHSIILNDGLTNPFFLNVALDKETHCLLTFSSFAWKFSPKSLLGKLLTTTGGQPTSRTSKSLIYSL